MRFQRLRPITNRRHVMVDFLQVCFYNPDSFVWDDSTVEQFSLYAYPMILYSSNASRNESSSDFQLESFLFRRNNKLSALSKDVLCRSITPNL